MFDGIVAIVLGALMRRASRKNRSGYGHLYHAELSFDLAQIKVIAEKYAIGTTTFTEFYQWGPWVKGGRMD